MVYEENLASWCLEDSPQMAERFDRSTAAMVKRDRNHPCVDVGPVERDAAREPSFAMPSSLAAGALLDEAAS